MSRITRVIRDVDVTRPTTPTGLAATPVSQTAINLSWNASTDPQGGATEAATGVVGYKLYRDGVLRVTQAGLTFADTGLSAYTTYSYRVTAYDGATPPNESVLSTAVTPRTLDTTAPTAPVVTVSQASSTSIAVALTTPSTDAGSGVASYRLEYKRQVDSTYTVAGAALTAIQFPFTITGLVAATAYDVQCRATDVSGNVGAYSAISSTSSDTTAPSAPVITATQTGTSSLSVALTTPATDGGAGYSSTFTTNESPLSDGGKWVQGGATGLLWQNVITSGGFAQGAGTSPLTSDPPDDGIAHLAASVGIPNDHRVTVTVRRLSSYNPSVGHENEILLRFSITPNLAVGYEIQFPIGGGLEIVRWNSLSNYTYITPANTMGASNDGDVLSAWIIGNVIRVSKNGVQVAQVTDSTFTTGQPGIGFFARPGATMNSYCFTDVAITPSSGTVGSGVASYQLEYKRTADSTWTVAAAALTAAQFPYSITGLLSGTAYDTRCRAKDVANNVGAYSTTSSATTTGTTSAVQKKWHPGHYLLLDGGDDTLPVLTTRVGEIANEPQVSGLMMRLDWDDLETTQGNYQWTLLDAVVSQMAAVDKYLWVLVRDRTFQGLSDANSAPVPAYVKDIGGITGNGVMATKEGGMAALHRVAVMDRQIALFQAIAARYEDSPYFHGFYNEESTPGFGTVGSGGVAPPGDFNNVLMAQQLVRMYTAVATVAKKTLFMASVNFPNDATIVTAVQGIAAAGQIGIGGPDAYPNGSFTPAENAYLGNTGGHNYVGELAAGFQFQRAGVKQQTFAEMWAIGKNTLRQQFFFWPRQTATTGDGANVHWLNTVLPALRTGTYVVDTTYPSTFGPIAWQTVPDLTFPSGVTSKKYLSPYVPATTTALAVSSGFTLPTGLTLNSAQQYLQSNGTVTTGSDKLTATYTAGSSFDAEWASQSTGAGVFFRHNFSFKNAAETQPITNKADMLASLSNYNADANTYLALDTTIKLSGVGAMRINMPASTWVNAFMGVDFAGIGLTSKTRSKHQFYVRFAHYQDQVFRDWDWGTGNVWHTMIVECYNSAFDPGEVVIHPARTPGGYMIGYSKTAANQTRYFGLFWPALGGQQTMNTFYDAGSPATVNSVNTLQQRYGMLWQDWNQPTADADIVNQPRAVSNGWTVYEMYIDQVNNVIKIWQAPYGQAPILMSGSMNAQLPAVGALDGGTNPQPIYTGMQPTNWRGSAPTQLPSQATFVSFAEFIASDNPIPFPGGYSLPYPGTTVPANWPPAGISEI